MIARQQSSTMTQVDCAVAEWLYLVTLYSPKRKLNPAEKMITKTGLQCIERPVILSLKPFGCLLFRGYRLISGACQSAFFLLFNVPENRRKINAGNTGGITPCYLLW